MSDEKTDLKDVFKRAAEIASVVPEAMQGEAFNRALEELKEQAGAVGQSAKPRRSRPQRKPGTQKGDTERIGQDQDDVSTLVEGIKSPDYPEINSKTSMRERSLRVLRLARKDFGIDGLSASDIAKILTDKFRIPTSRQAADMALKHRPDLADRSRRGGINIYRIMEPGEQFLDAPSEERDEPSMNRASKKRNKASKRKAPKKATTRSLARTESAKTTRRASGRPGPKKMLENLISDGYFDEPRTIGNMMSHIGNKKAHTYKATDLSPALRRLVRELKLDREQDDDGQFEYQSKR